MIHTLHFKGAVWLDLDNPTADEIKEVTKTYSLPGEAADELSLPSKKSKIEVFKNVIYLSLHFPVFKHSHTKESSQEIDFIIGNDFIITARYDSNDPLHRIAKVLETEAIIEKSEIFNPAGYIFFRILRELYDALFNELAFLDNWANEIEVKIFKGSHKEMVEEISNTSKVLIDFKRTLSQHKEVLDSLKDYGGELYGDHFAYHTKNIIYDYAKLKNMIESQREIISELRETNNSILSTKQNEVAKIITVLAFIAVPMSLIISLFQIDTVSRPIIGMEYDFWILLGFIFLVGFLLLVFFRHRKWL